MKAAAIPAQRFPIPDILKKMYRVFETAGFEAYLVGGMVRDTFLGKKAADYDIATNASPTEVMKLFRRVIPTGIEHGTVTVLFMDSKIEVTTFRLESGYSDGRHPDAVSFNGTITDDLSRRDFTCNAIAVNLKNGEVIDPFNGQEDIRRRIIRTVGSPFARFTEDALRPIRAIRFSACLNFSIDDLTLEAISLSLYNIKSISIERFRDEFIKTLGAKKPSQAFKILEDCGILRIFIPELAACRNVIQSDGRGYHRFDVLDHLFYACDGAPQMNLNVRLAALFHDIAKPLTKQVNTYTAEDGSTQTVNNFFNHEKTGAQLTESILLRLRFPTRTAAYVARLVREHMFRYESVWTDAAIRRFAARVGTDALDDLFDLHTADAYGMTGTPVESGEWIRNMLEFKDRLHGIIAEKNALGIKDLAVTGRDLIADGIPQGVIIGRILKELFETVLDDPAENEKAHLLTLARNIYAGRT